MAVDFRDERATEVFRKLCETMLIVRNVPNGKAEEPKEVCSAVMEEVDIIQPEQAEQEWKKEPEKETGISYRGFMHLQCSECKDTKSFMMKREADHYHCDNCGARTVFDEPLIPLYVNCECGGKYRYMTNMHEEIFDIGCLSCGAPVPVRYNEKKRVYETIRG